MQFSTYAPTRAQKPQYKFAIYLKSKNYYSGIETKIFIHTHSERETYADVCYSFC